MINKPDFTDAQKPTDTFDLVEWSAKYSTGIAQIDKQHKDLVHLTNELFQACRSTAGELDNAFKDTLRRMVEYVRSHFTQELVLLERIHYPDYHEHKNLHDELIKTILAAVKEHNEGKTFIPNHFVRTLRDWVFGHIAVYDQKYALYIKEQKRKGLLTDIELN